MLKLLKSVPEVMWVANSSLKNGANSLFAQKRSFFLEGVSGVLRGWLPAAGIL